MIYIDNRLIFRDFWEIFISWCASDISVMLLSPYYICIWNTLDLIHFWKCCIIYYVQLWLLMICSYRSIYMLLSIRLCLIRNWLININDVHWSEFYTILRSNEILAILWKPQDEINVGVLTAVTAKLPSKSFQDSILVGV